MKKAVFIFPGQGAQKSGMGKDIYDTFPVAKEMFDAFPEIRDICFSGTEEQLKQTSITQPAIYLLSVIIDRILKENNLKPERTAGHSLGEYSALVSANVMDWKTGVQLVQERGKRMQDAGQRIPGTMAAIIGLSDETIIETCKKISGVVEPVNFNAPEQVVISGEVQAVQDAMKAFQELKAKMVVPLNVSGAFHSSLLKETAEGFKSFLGNFSFQDPSCPVIANVDAEFYPGKTALPEKLSAQICSPVLWTKMIQKLISEGYKDFIEVGPGNVLKGLMKRIDSTCTVETTKTADELKNVITKYTSEANG